MQTLDALYKSQNYGQGIIHDGAARGQTTVLDIGYQHSMVGMGGWDIIKRHGTCIDAKFVIVGGSSMAGRHFQLVDTRVVVKIF